MILTMLVSDRSTVTPLSLPPHQGANRRIRHHPPANFDSAQWVSQIRTETDVLALPSFLTREPALRKAKPGTGERYQKLARLHWQSAALAATPHWKRGCG